MELYSFVRGLLAWIASVACLWPVNVPLLYFAQRIREGQTPEDDRIDGDELRTRSILASLVLAMTTALFLFADVVAADWAALPAGLVHFVVLLAYIPTAAYVLTLFFAFDDYFHGLGLLTLYLGLPLFVLFSLNALIGFWNPVVGWFGQWLTIPT